MFNFFYTIFGYLFRFLFSFIDNYGVALLVFTLFFRIIIMPTNIKTQKSQAKTVRMQPKLKRIREKYADYSPQERNQKIQEETNALYQREGYSAMTAGCAPLLIQLPILWGLYGVVRQPLTYVLQTKAGLIDAFTNAVTSLGYAANRAYAETAIITHIDTLVKQFPSTAAQYVGEIEKIKNFDFKIFGIDLGSVPSVDTIKNWGAADTAAKILILIPILSFVTSMMTSVLTQVRQQKNNPNMENQAQMGCMMLSMPLMSLFFTFQFPAGMGMYWIFSNVFAFFQTFILGAIYAPRKTIARDMVDEMINARALEKQKKIQKENN